MGSFIEFIFNNPFLLFIIIAGIVSFFNRLTSSGEQAKQSRDPDADETGRTSTVRDVMRKMQEMADSLDPEVEEKKSQRRTEKKGPQPLGKLDSTAEKTPAYSFEEERAAQYRQLKEQYTSATKSEEVEPAFDFASPIYQETGDASTKRKDQSDVTINLNKSLKDGGLVESVVMAEILGPPRAKKRYSNRFYNR